MTDDIEVKLTKDIIQTINNLENVRFIKPASNSKPKLIYNSLSEYVEKSNLQIKER